jgi:hypothetical protein
LLSNAALVVLQMSRGDWVASLKDRFGNLFLWIDQSIIEAPSILDRKLAVRWTCLGSCMLARRHSLAASRVNLATRVDTMWCTVNSSVCMLLKSGFTLKILITSSANVEAGMSFRLSPVR